MSLIATLLITTENEINFDKDNPCKNVVKPRLQADYTSPVFHQKELKYIQVTTTTTTKQTNKQTNKKLEIITYAIKMKHFLPCLVILCYR